MSNKVKTVDEIVGELRSGMTIGIGGWGSRRKPMALVRAICASDLSDLTIVSFGGPDLGLLCACSKVKRAIYGFASLDTIPLEPHFRKARQAGSIATMELDEGMVKWGLYAASLRLPFLPTRAGLGSDVMRLNPELRTVDSPYDDGDTFVAMPALQLDAALIHAHRADTRGNVQILGPDPFFDDLFAGAADRCFVSAETVVPAGTLFDEVPMPTLSIPRLQVSAVAEVLGGAHFTECPPLYDRDATMLSAYAQSAKDADAWHGFQKHYFETYERGES